MALTCLEMQERRPLIQRLEPGTTAAADEKNKPSEHCCIQSVGMYKNCHRLDGRAAFSGCSSINTDATERPSVLTEHRTGSKHLIPPTVTHT